MPPKPSAMASIRRQPTRSTKTSAAPSVTVSGNTCNTAVTLASGMFISAVRKK